MAKKSSEPKKTTKPEKKAAPAKKEAKKPIKKPKDEEEEEDEDEDLDLDAEDDEEEEEEDLDTIQDDMLAGEEEEEAKRTPDQIELMLRETECSSCPGSSSKLRCKVRTDYGCPDDKKDL